MSSVSSARGQRLSDHDEINERHQVDHVFAGNLCNLPQRESAVVRIFLSSTFTDMQSERNWLMKNAVPHLRRFCQERGLDFQIADMRWGVQEDATDDHSTTELCLREIKNCQRVSRGPNFVAILGDKYGYRPLPAKIESNQFRLIKNTAMKMGYDTTLLLNWYLCDNNEEPAMYILQSITSVYPNFFDQSPANANLRQQSQREWAVVMEKLIFLFRECADHLYNEGKITKKEKHLFFQSVTDNEVAQGILTAENVEDTVICFQRALIELDMTDPVAGRYTDLFDDGIDVEAEELREHLKLVKLPEVLPPSHLYRYNVPWKAGGVSIAMNTEHLRYVEQFGQNFTKAVEKMIESAVDKSMSGKAASPLFEEVLHHLHFCQSKCDTFCGRENLLNKIHSKLVIGYGTKNKNKANENNESTDESATNEGSEESKIAANVYESEREKRKQVTEEHDQIIQHLATLGVVYTAGDNVDDIESDPNFSIRDRLMEIPQMTSYTKPLIVYGESGCGKTALMAKVTDLSKEWFPNSYCLVRFLGTSTMSTTIREVLVSLCLQIWHLYKVPKPTGIDLESDFQFLVKYFAALLWQIDTVEHPLVIVLDSIDQLSPADHAHFFNWIPHKLPKSVHFLISIVANRHDCLKNIKQIFVQDEQFIEVNKFESETASAMITALCKKANRHLSKKQQNLLMDKFNSCSQPLFLKLLTDMSLSWKSYTKVNTAALGVTIKEAINHLFDNLEKKHSTVLIKKAFAYLCAAREGLTEQEMEDLLSLDDEVLQDTYIYHLPPDPDVIRLPPLLWKRVHYDIEEYLVERQSGGKKVITWYHRQFMEAANERYLTDQIRTAVHNTMAEYFQGTWSSKFKHLELKKGKRGSFPKAVRNVPPQPLKLSTSLYNTRKLSELPLHLVNSDQYKTLLMEFLLDPAWLYAKCHTSSLTMLMADIQMAETGCAAMLENDKKALKEMEAYVEKHNKKKDEKKVQKVQEGTEVLAGIKQLAKMILLASDSVRKDPVYLPLQVSFHNVLQNDKLQTQNREFLENSLIYVNTVCIGQVYSSKMVCQLGPHYHDSALMEQFVIRCQKWCQEAVTPLFLPLRECMMKPEGYLLYTIEVDLFMTETFDRPDSPFQGLYLRDDVNQLFVVNKQSAKPDKIAVFDINDYGSCIQMEDFNQHIFSIEFAAKNKYLVLDTSDPHETFKLYRSSIAAPVVLPHPPKTITVSNSGKYVAYSSGTLVEVLTMTEGTPTPYYTIKDHEDKVTALVISPDDSILVTSGYSMEVFKKKAPTLIFDLTSKALMHKIAVELKITRQSVITKQNYLICSKAGYNENGVLVVLGLEKGEILKEVNTGRYTPDIILLHSSQLYVLVGFLGTSVINGDNSKFARLVSINTGQCLSTSPINGPYGGVALFGNESIYYALCEWNKIEVTILFAGLKTKPLVKATPVYCLYGHNQPVIQILVTANLETMYTASRDNTIKVWDISPVLEDFLAELKRMEKLAGPEADLDDVAAQLKPPVDTRTAKTTQVALNRLGDLVYVGTDNSELRMYSIETGQLKLTSDLDIGPVGRMFLSKSGQFLVVGGRKIHIEDLQSTNSKVLEPRGRLSCMAESNNILVAGSAGMEAKGRVWNIATGEILKDFELLYSFDSVAINSLGNMVVSTIFDFPIVVHLTSDSYEGSDIDTNSMDTMMSSGICCCISPNDKLAACGSADGAVRVITMMGKYLYRLQQRSSAVSLAFKPDGKVLVSAGYRSIYVWNMKDGSLRLKLTRHRDFVNSMKFDETGRYLLTASRDKQLVLWDFRRHISVATCQTHCQVSSIDLGPRAETVVYIPEGISDLSILRPNQSLAHTLAGKFKPVVLPAQTQALALAFSGQTTGKTSRACSIM